MSPLRDGPDFALPKDASASSSSLPWALAGGVILAVLAVILLTSHKRSAPGTTLLPLAANAQMLAFSGIQMSESESLSGGKVTYIDGHVRNTGTKTVTEAQLQVVFANDTNMPPQLESVPLGLIRTREPYIDTESLAAAPLGPGEIREFRLPFENIGDNWNQQLPQLRVTRLDLR